jgi:hypothetical protein
MPEGDRVNDGAIERGRGTGVVHRLADRDRLGVGVERLADRVDEAGAGAEVLVQDRPRDIRPCRHLLDRRLVGARGCGRCTGGRGGASTWPARTGGRWRRDGPDAAILPRIVADGLALGAAGFAADIEAPSPAQDTSAYATSARLGFRIPYTRTHHMRGR